MHITNGCILFGGKNSDGNFSDSAQISAGKHKENSLNIVGMGKEVVDRRIDIWAEGGITIRGRIKTPINNVIAFSASINKDMVGNISKIEFKHIHYNTGNSFKDFKDFIAPVEGLYMFTIAFRRQASGGYWILRLNNTKYVNEIDGTEKKFQPSSLASSVNENTTVSMTVITYLKINDKVHVEQLNSQIRTSTHASSFSGMLLKAIV